MDNTNTSSSQTDALRVLLDALDEANVSSDTPVEILVRVQGKADRTLKISLDNPSEMREILRRTLGAA